MRASPRILVMLLLLVAGAPSGAAAATKPPASRLLYASDWLGPTQIFAADPQGGKPIAQITFDRTFDCRLTRFACGFTRPAASPDGRHVAYETVGYQNDGPTLTSPWLWISEANGRDARKLGAGCCAVWSADSRRVFYLLDETWHVVRVDGTRDRAGVSPPKRRSSYDSPNGRWHAGVTEDGIWINRRLVAHEQGFYLSWSPDSKLLAYISGGPLDQRGSPTGDLKVITPAGKVRTIVSADEPYGGQIQSLTWARERPRTKYRRPAPTDGVFAGSPIDKLAADGDTVAFTACEGLHVFAWQPPSARAVEVGASDRAKTDGSCDLVERAHVYDVAVARDRIAWAENDGASSFGELIESVRLGSRTRVTLATGGGSLGDTEGRGFGQLIGAMVGAGDLLVFGVWRTPYDGSDYSLMRETLYRAGWEGCPCPAIAYGAAAPAVPPFIPLDTDGSRLAVLRYGAVVILDSSGDELQAFPTEGAAAAQLAGDELVVLVRGAIRTYETSTRRLLRTWPLPEGTVGRDCRFYSEPASDFRRAPCPDQVDLVLSDAADGLAAYTFHDELHVVRLADGKDRAVGFAKGARFMKAGLAYADGSRVRLLRYAALR